MYSCTSGSHIEIEYWNFIIPNLEYLGALDLSMTKTI